MPSRASSIWVFIGTPLRIEIFNGTRKKRKLPIKADSIERRQVLFSDFNPLLSDFSAVSVSHSLFFAFKVTAAFHKRRRHPRAAAEMEMDIGGKAVLVAETFRPQVVPLLPHPVEPLDLRRHLLHLRVVKLVAPGDRPLRAEDGFAGKLHLPVAERLSAREHPGGHRKDTRKPVFPHPVDPPLYLSLVRPLHPARQVNEAAAFGIDRHPL